MEKLKGRIRIYASGGAGTNIVKPFEAWRNEVEPGRANFYPVYIDTSRSNLSEHIPEEEIYLFGDVDGSGGIRKDNAKAITERAKEILQKFEPMDLNIVVSSASGGSGSVIGPSIVSELLAADQSVVVIIIGGTDTKLRIENTVKTIKSYEGIVGVRSKGVVAAYLENSAEMPRQQVDEAAFRLISSLGYVYSRENAELDSRDLFNFLHFERPTAYKPQLAGLNMFWGKIPDEHTHDVISMATVVARGQDHSLSFLPDYQCTGYLPEEVAPEMKNLGAIHFTTHATKFSEVYKSLDGRLKTAEKAQKARVSTTKLLDDADDVTDNGLVF